jgi:hypothetical protein
MMPNRRLPIALLLAATMLGAAPAAAQSSTADVERRLAALEAEIGRLRAELAAAKATPAVAPVATAAAAPAAAAPTVETRVAALEEKAAKPADGFKVAGTTFKLGGFVKLWSAVSHYSGGSPAPGALIRDFYLPQQIPVGGVGSTHTNMHAKQTRLWMSGATPVGDRTLGGYVEIDFQTAQGTQGTERTTNGYNPALRRAYATLSTRGGQLLVGQEWSTFQNIAALPETTDFIGTTEGSVFVRQPMIRYTANLSPQFALAVALENPETASITTTSAALLENDDDKVPDAVVRLTAKPGKAELTLAGVLHDVRVVNDAGVGDSSLGWGISGAGKVPLGGSGRHDLRFMLTYGQGVGHYLGLNFAPDAVVSAGRLDTVDVFAGFAALKFGWTPTLRSTFMASFQHVEYPALVIPAAANASAWSVAGNLFWTPVKGFDLGLEYRHGEREIVSGATGQLDRFELSAKYTF